MFEIIVTILIVIALAIAAVLFLASRKPDTFRVQRAAIIDAAPEKIFPLISDFHQWRTWSPWEQPIRTCSAATAALQAARARCTNGRATGMSAPGAWKSW